jgi:hypothetical protein
MLLFCCNSAYILATGWEKFICSMEDNYSPTARKVVLSYYQTHCAWYAEGNPVTPGKILATFKDAKKWNGRSDMDGRHHKIKILAAMLAKIAKTWVRDKLPDNGKLAPLVLKMIKCFIEWIYTIHKHFNLEYLKLTQQLIQEEDALILLLEELIIMYNCIHTVRHQRMEFVASWANKVDYMVLCIWIMYQVHRVMQELIEDGLKYNTAISTTFVCFLTNQMGGNVSSGARRQIKTLTDMIAMLKGLVVAATTATKEASQTAKEANTRATMANTNANAAKNAVNSNYSKNSTLKR